MFGSSPETAGFLDIQWADIVFILVLRGHVRYIIINNITLLHDCILTVWEMILNSNSGGWENFLQIYSLGDPPGPPKSFKMTDPNFWINQ